MDRYYKTELVTKERSLKNRSLYEEINELDNYSNIEGVANIENSNEIDISKVREMLKNRDEYKKQQRMQMLLKTKQEKESPQETLDEIKSYDINSVLSKVRENSSKEKYRSLDNEQYEEMNEQNQVNEQYEEHYQNMENNEAHDGGE